ncbi:hypothetical protein S40293_10315 [Stachybotrys chartarum IBT 40293]|nr:hypothetical protein S40293_10315 [Stachybotrys chartarum IBT 40293]
MDRQLPDHEIRVQNALESIGRGVAIRRAAHNFSIPESTLRGRVQGRVSQRIAYLKAQQLSPIPEKSLVNWILAEEQAGRAPTKVQMLAFTESIAAVSSRPVPFGHNWVDRFLQRNKEVKTKAL